MLAVYIALLFLIVLFALAKPNTIINNNSNAKILSSIIVIFISINIIFREQIHDTQMYIFSFKQSIGQELGYLIRVLPYDTFWTLFQWIISQLTNSTYIFLAIIWFIFLLGLLKFLNNLFTPWQLLIVLFSYTAFVFFYSYATMALRQGIAISFLLLAISSFMNDKKNTTRTIALLITSFLFHWSSLPFALITFIIFKFKIRLRHLIITWCILSVMYLFEIQSYILSPFINLVPKLEIYTSSTVLSTYSGVNRIDFLLFSAIWIIYSLLFLYFNKNETYKLLTKLYVSFNTIFLLFGFVAYSDRIAGYSWFLIPVIIWYPLLKRKKYPKELTAIAITGFVLVSFLTGTYNHLYW